jgi:hypothetical protein
MANIRISDLPQADLPLVGGELLVVVQEGVTAQVPLGPEVFGFDLGTDWTQDQGAVDIHPGNIPDLTATYAPLSHNQAETTITFTDVPTGNASTTAHGFSPKATAPAAGSLSVLGIAHGETVRTDKVLLEGCTSISVVDFLPDPQVTGVLYFTTS